MKEARERQETHFEIVFLPFKVSAWNTMENMWRQAKENPDYDVYVIPIPYYYKDWNGKCREMRYEGEKFPDEVLVTHYEEYDFEKRHPDVIVIHNPYDRYNPVTSVPPFFYSDNLKKHTNKLVYTPYFFQDEPKPEDQAAWENMSCYAATPGVINADQVIVQSEMMRSAYIDFLSEKTGEDTRKIWENKICSGKRFGMSDMAGTIQSNFSKSECDTFRQFSNDYFQDEVQDGFYVPGMMKRAWAAQLEVLADVDKVCRKHGIQYFADWGTLLGAVRHGGFIPWDDDLDICMKREDYYKFLAVAPKELPPEYGMLNFHTAYNGEYMWQFISRVVNQKDICFDEKHLEKFHDFPYVSGIDIYPLDYEASDEEGENLRMNLITLVTYARNLLDAGNKEELEEQLRLLEELCHVQIDRAGNLRQQLYCLEEQLMSLYREEESQTITRMTGELEENRCRYPKVYYQSAIMLPFENTEIPVPVHYDEILKSLYGEYQEPIHGGSAHDYPFYKKQENILPEKFGVIPVKYEISADLVKSNR